MSNNSSSGFLFVILFLILITILSACAPRSTISPSADRIRHSIKSQYGLKNVYLLNREGGDYSNCPASNSHGWRVILEDNAGKKYYGVACQGDFQNTWIVMIDAASVVSKN